MTNLVWPNGTVIKTAQESYADGYQTGLTWYSRFPTHHYVPGGPWEHNGHCSNEHIKKCADQTKRNNAEWVRGFKNGRGDKGDGSSFCGV